MKQKQKIVLGYYLEGKSCLTIVRETGLNWRTVKKYVDRYEKAKKEAFESGSMSDGSVLLSEVVDPPKYDSSGRGKRKLSESMIAEIEKCLADNEEKALNRQRKQRMKKIDIHEYLRSLGYDIGYTTVATFISELERKKQETFIRQAYNPGEVCEFDWGEVKIKLKGKHRICYMAAFTSAYSNYRFAVLFERQDKISFKRSHALFFDHTGGSYKEMVYDNMKVAVKKFTGSEKSPTEALLKLSMYYLFRYRFCNLRKGNEKGHVERSVEHIRRKAFCRKGSEVFETLEEANSYLLEVCLKLNDTPQKLANDRTGVDLFMEEKKYLNDYVTPFECFELACKRVDKYGTVSVCQNMYSVPEEYTGQMVDARIYPEKIVCYSGGRIICEHVRTYGVHQWNIKIDHYLNTFLKKPGALSGSVALKNSSQELKALYRDYFKDNKKDFIELLIYRKNTGRNIIEIMAAVNEILKSGCMSVSTEKIKCICERKKETAPFADNASNEIVVVSARQLSEHSSLMTKGGGHEIR